MKDKKSPLLKPTTMAFTPLRFRGVPRRSRVLVYIVLIIFLISLLPKGHFGGIGKTLLFFLVSPEFAGPYNGNSQKVDILRYVDPLIGTTNGGHVFPGASLPYGMAKAVADTLSPAENAAGFVSDDNPVLGFSHMHDSGTGGQPSLGNFPIFVHPGCPDDDFKKCLYTVYDRPVYRVPDSVYASPGYFSINLTNSVRAEMTVTQHAALYRFSFLNVNQSTVTLYNNQSIKIGDVPYSPLILVDLIDLMNSRQMGGIQVYPETGRVIGQGKYSPSFGSGTYQAFFCADFKGAQIRKTGTFMGTSNVTEGVNKLDSAGGFYIPSGSAGAWIQFEPPPKENTPIMARVGLSFMSIDQACNNAENEMSDWGFERIESDARKQWREKLEVIQIDGTDAPEEYLTTFWSGLYRTLLSPQNYTSENPLWNSSEPYFDSFYCIWDSFRAQHPLLNILDPQTQTSMVRALLDIYLHEGHLPDCRMSFCKGFTQGGSNADVVITDTYLKLPPSLHSQINWTLAYSAVLTDAEVEPPSWGIAGRGNLHAWHILGYIPYDDVSKNGTGPQSRSISRGFEYAYNDYTIWVLGQRLSRGNDDDNPSVYLSRSTNWRNFWNPNQKDLYREEPSGPVLNTSFVGFPQPRSSTGQFDKYQSTRSCSPVHDMHSCYFDTGLETYEGSPWLYSFFVPHQMSTLVSLMDGPEGFVDRLTYFHESGIAYMGNEQSFLTVFQFHYASRPGLSSYWAHQYIPSLFNTSLNGIPGNDDCAMGAFSAFAMMGFFPVAGQDVYLLTPPFFKEIKIRATENPKKWVIIRVRNFDPEGKRIYIQSAELNGKKYTKNWITHEIFLKGGTLEYIVGEQESKTWGVGQQDLPPSYEPPEEENEEDELDEIGSW
ncbi:family 92 putative glycoside hydrolase [Podospora fimiseda]|uniref:Family 92 putative glycoside hydrolase n=1 Tax=Podospora fimiseda TaxID=252190 RepID=A0AAN7BV18_9PEZI|nr:family 92 putative glycoside hydrolase [Podospora fimiseda]